jgi:hypothetical protein
MAITNYGELKTAIKAWQYNAKPIQTYAADIVTLSQGWLNRNLRCREMITVSDITIGSGVYALPSNYLQYVHVVEKASTRRPLTFISQTESDRVYPSRPSGLGETFTIIGSNIRVFPTPSNQIELTYYAALAAFANDAATDWLLTKLPNLYLATGCMFAAELLKDDVETQKQLAIAQMYLDQLKAEDDGNILYGAAYFGDGPTP